MYDKLNKCTCSAISNHSILCERNVNKPYNTYDDDSTAVFVPTIVDEKLSEVINDTSVSVPHHVGSRREEEFREFLKLLIEPGQVDQIRAFLSDYASSCACVSMEYVCLGHQIASLFEIETPFPTEFDKYSSIFDYMRQNMNVPMDRGGYNVPIRKDEVENV